MTANITASGGKTKQPQRRQLPPPPAPPSESVPRPADMPDDGILRFTNKGAPKEKRSVLFRIDGAEYTVLDNPTASLGLEYLEQVRRRGPIGAVAWAMDTMLGPEAYLALRACKNLPPEGLQRVVEVVIEKLDASMSIPKEDDED